MTFITENGWPSCGIDDCDSGPVPGTDISIPLQRGIPNTIMKAFAADINQSVESLYNGPNGSSNSDEGGWTPTNSVATSNHLGGTAMDLNWSDHPMGPQVPDPAAGWQWSAIIGGPEEPAVRELLAFYTYQGIQLIWWGNDWDSPHDSMHFQMGYDTYDNQAICNDFIAQFIGSDGFSTYHAQAPAAPATAAVLGNAMENEVSSARYAELLPAFQTACARAQINNLNRLAMFCAQLGEESGGLQWQQEIADGSEYDNRPDLGNGPTDGPTFKGRDFIQITGRNNYTALSAWAFGQGIVPTPTYFVDNPTDLATDQYAFVGVVWYWTVARSDLNQLADNQDITGATEAINGGTNGLADRTDRWNKCLAMGDTLLALITDSGGFMANISDADAAAVVAAANKILNRWASRSIYRASNDAVDDTVGMLLNVDGSTHEAFVEREALLGEPTAVALVTATANGTGVGAKMGDGTTVDQAAIDRAKFILSKVPAAKPARKPKTPE